MKNSGAYETPAYKNSGSGPVMLSNKFTTILSLELCLTFQKYFSSIYFGLYWQKKFRLLQDSFIDKQI